MKKPTASLKKKEMCSYLMNKLLILGINGFAGRHIQHNLDNNNLKMSYEIVGVDQIVDRLADVKYIEADLTKKKNIEKILTEEKPDYILNLIGTYKKNDDFNTLLNINALITRDLLEVIINNKLKIKNTTIIGTAAEYGYDDTLPIKENLNTIPVNNYGLSKLIQTNICLYYQKKYSLNICIARPFNIIGNNLPKNLSIGSFVHQIKNAKDEDTIFVGNLNTKRDFLHINDVISAYFCILEKGKRGKIYNICSGRSYYIKDILDYLVKTSGKKINIVVKSEFIKKDDIEDIYGDNAELVHDTGWKKKIDIYASLDKLIN